MIRVASQLTYFSPQKILRNTVIERDIDNFITQIYSLNDRNVESAQTFFFDGIISAELISIKLNSSTKNVHNSLMNYSYWDLSQHLPLEIKTPDKPLIIDFGANSISEINDKLPRLTSILIDFSIFDLIAACVFYPAIALGKTNNLTLNHQHKLILWENADLVNNRLFSNTKLRVI